MIIDRGLKIKCEYEIDYQNDFSIVLFRLHIIKSHTYPLHPINYPFYLKPAERASETSMVRKSKLVLNVVFVVQSEGP